MARHRLIDTIKTMANTMINGRAKENGKKVTEKKIFQYFRGNGI